MPVLKQLALKIGPLRRLYEDRNRLASKLAQGRDLENGVGQNRFYHYTAAFDAIGTMHRYAAANLEPTPGYLTNWLGVRIDPKFFPHLLVGRAGEVEGMPMPANWHADIAEWAAVLQAVDDANLESFTMIELGCGWGCWINNAGVAARSTGRRVHVIGVEGDEGHVGFARESLATNGFASDQISLYRGIAAAQSGFALFPRQNKAGVKWGLEPVFGATEAQRDAALAAGSHDILPMIPMADLVATHERIDLLHIDIQGGEADLIDCCLPLLNKKVAYMVIGTHSKQIEGRLYDTLLSADWRLQMERAAIFGIASGRPYIEVDGVQGWRNPRLLRR